MVGPGSGERSGTGHQVAPLAIALQRNTPRKAPAQAATPVLGRVVSVALTLGRQIHAWFRS